MHKNSYEKIVPDTSIIVEGFLSLKLEKNELACSQIIVHEASLAELEHQANQGREIGLFGLEEIKKLQNLAKEKDFELKFGGRRPSSGEIKYAGLGEIDALIRQLAWEEGAALMTADEVQAKTGEARGLQVVLVPKEKALRKLKLESFFDESTMSVHIRELVPVVAKKGRPGVWTYTELGKPVSRDEVKIIAKEIIEEARARSDGFIEIEREGSTIIQLGNYRIVIVKPPFSDGWEITAVRPVALLKLEDYKLSEKLLKRLSGQAEGVLIAGSPGQGKSTFAQALAEFFLSKGKIVKTVEAPRDLVLPDHITQLAISHGSSEEVHDVLLLSRPDYTIFDEMRNTNDFMLYSDLRLAGVGMLGVVHGTEPLDAIQRFIGKIDLGVIPHVIDTVLFIKNGKIDKVFHIKMVVKVPSGMTEADLARPTVVVNDFETDKPIAEIYSYGEETVVVPVSEVKIGGLQALAVKSIERALQKYTDELKVELAGEGKAIVYVPERFIAGIIGREGKNVSKLEEELGVGLDIRELTEKLEKSHGRELQYKLEEAPKYLEIVVNNPSGRPIDIHVGGEFLATFAVGKKGVIRIKKDNQLGKTLADAVNTGSKISVFEI